MLSSTFAATAWKISLTCAQAAGERVLIHYVRDQSRQSTFATLGERTVNGETSGFLGVGYEISLTLTLLDYCGKKAFE